MDFHGYEKLYPLKEMNPQYIVYFSSYILYNTICMLLFPMCVSMMALNNKFSVIVAPDDEKSDL